MNENDMTNFLRLRNNVELEHPLEMMDVEAVGLSCSPNAHTRSIVF